jgi:hypothetical protein
MSMLMPYVVPVTNLVLMSNQVMLVPIPGLMLMTNTVLLYTQNDGNHDFLIPSQSSAMAPICYVMSISPLL